MRALLRKAIDIASWPGRVVGWLLLPLIVTVCMSVWAAQVGRNAFASWEEPVFLLGRGITVNTLLDFQWHAFALIVLFGGTLALRDGRHVSVDFLSSGFSRRARAAVRAFGDLVLLVPFCAIIAWYGIDFAERAFASGEGSSYGGMTHFWMIKAAVPAAFTLLGLAGLARGLLALGEVVRPGSAGDGLDV